MGSNQLEEKKRPVRLLIAKMFRSITFLMVDEFAGISMEILPILGSEVEGIKCLLDTTGLWLLSRQHSLIFE